MQVDGHRLRLTNLRQVLYPEGGFTKAEALHYYARVAPGVDPVGVVSQAAGVRWSS